MNRKDIQIISLFSNIRREKTNQLLKGHVYHHKKDWKQFILFFTLSLGIGFSIAGILFFFAYNWDYLHKFLKFGLIEGLLIGCIVATFFTRKKPFINKVLITSACILTGILLAVFGQVYQTGADAYDLFLIWTILITAWVILAAFPPLWIIFLLLVNITFFLFAQQMAPIWPDVLVLTISFGINLMFALLFTYGRGITTNSQTPSYLIYIPVLTAVTCSTTGLWMGIFNSFTAWFVILIILTAISYSYWLYYGLQKRKLFYLTLIPISIIILICAVLIKISDGASMFFAISFIVIGSVTFMITKLIALQKKWDHDKLS